MSEHVPSQRPVAVRSAAGLLVAMATVGVAYAVAGLLAMDGTVARFRSATTDLPDRGAVDGVVTLLRATTALTAVLAVAVGALLVALALGLLTGRAGARVATWVVCGLGLLAGIGAVALLVGQRLTPFRLDVDQHSTAVLLNALTDAYPEGWVAVNAGLSIGQALGYLVVAVLLALPSANAHHRRRPVSRPASRSFFAYSTPPE
ncbi:hypothetical protein GA0074692_4970 [Micromonospora pallida]|uniref:Uncharacterized protein n=1 Tax=Micromonospora pallida TaxID=145854 RepID=A0A1C6T965_9ACTN|nr:hypothetical protein [Micromonospora pallida]SCL38314.1 hypothetical protein GA0074692_4970 [Micromonospora pallida]